MISLDQVKINTSMIDNVLILVHYSQILTHGRFILNLNAKTVIVFKKRF